MHQALYRKWRPKTFDSLIGQEPVATTLKNQVSSGKLSHAYLFCGTRGTGKTSSARILAKAVNCLEPRNGNPCCECDICRAADSETLLDITEIDAASNSGVDNIRELREEAGFTPVAARFRVYIIDETHMLSIGAFNALLKILEEPPEHVLFILATTEIHKVPATIVSRCQRFDFRRVPGHLIAQNLLDIAREEGLSLQEDAALLIARLADGGLRDAHSLLDLVMANGGDITVQLVSDSLGMVNRSHLFELAEAVLSGESGAVLDTARALWERSIDYQRLCEQLIGFYRDVMVSKAVRDPAELIACLPDELERFRVLASRMDMSRILDCLNIMQDTLAKMSRASHRRTELEIGLLRLVSSRSETASRPMSDSATNALTARIEALEHALYTANPSPADNRGGGKAAGNPERREAPARTVPDKSGDKAPLPYPENPGGQVSAKVSADVSAKDISKAVMRPFEAWDKVLDILKDKNRALYGTLADSKAYEGSGLLLVDAGDGMFARMVRGDSYAKESLRDAAEAVTGQKYRLGPYDPERYEIREAPPNNELEDILKQASELGVDVQITQ